MVDVIRSAGVVRSVVNKTERELCVWAHVWSSLLGRAVDWSIVLLLDRAGSIFLRPLPIVYVPVWCWFCCSCFLVVTFSYVCMRTISVRRKELFITA